MLKAQKPPFLTQIKLCQFIFRYFFFNLIFKKLVVSCSAKQKVCYVVNSKNVVR